ncbi:hypothetical protein AGOR_G00034930 [Albula goreensis]|uniref:VWFD domain-containing protein n=1 Tax=Albula goreensis TaxID=1534307 RepID=A0A8T3DZU9_9TELE|nr:hypothetical protein AGOR_G00034930 [Albula goreensis]
MKGDIATCIKKPPPVKMGTCWVMGDPHYRTFDGQYFNFMGNCTYTMAKNCQIDKEHPAFEVEAKNDNRGNTQVTSVSKVIVKVYGHVIEMIRGDLGLVRLDYQDWSLPINLDKGKVTLVNSGLSALLETDFGLTVQYDWEQYLVVTVPGSYAGKVCGLCGNFNGKKDDDMTTPMGSKASNVVALGKSWRVHSAEGDSHCRDECTGKCANCKSSFLGHLGAEFFCSILTVLMKGPFRSCHAVIDPSIFHDICMYDFCMGDGVRKYLCDSLQVYTDACQRAGIEVYNWRRLARCPDPKCQEHSHYELCGNACPATCENPHAPSKCKSHCVETCACDPGYLLSGNKCVPSSQCGCKYEGRYVLPNQSFWGNNDCTKNCTCNPTSGKVECRDTVCPSGKQCQVVDGLRDCYPMSYATCLATGDPHYLTFDGHRYNLPGTCVYQMAGVCSKNINLEPFDILVQNHVQNNRVGSVTKLVEVKVYEQSIVITKQYRKHVVMVNGEIMNLPINLLDKRVLVYKSGLYAVIKTNFGLKVYFDWNSVVIVNVPNTYEGAMCGLCGNYNNKPQDDMKMKDGKVAPTVKELGESWRVAKIPGCVDGCRGPCPDCDITQLEQYKTNEYCGLLNDPKGPFRKCHAVWDPSHLVQDCLYDVCLYKGKNNMQCNILAAYTSICQKQGVEVEDWRNLTKCSFPCQKNSHYEICASGCPATCATLAPPVGCKSPCMEDCVCDEGYILSGDKCVPFSKCGCTLEGKYYKIGQTFYPHGKCEEECTCNDDGMVDCKKFTCGPHERCKVKNGQRGCYPFGSGNCSIYGDPHYRTFDNSTYDFQGTCTYTVSKACHLEGTRLKPFSVVVENENWNGVIDFKADTPPVNVSVARSVAVQVYGYTLILRKNQIGSIMVNGILYTLPMELNNGAVKAYEHGFQDVIETDFGLKVTYDLVFKVTVTVPGNYRGKTCGLCGNFNDDASDELQMPDGKITKSMKDFGAAWKVSTPDVVCDDGCSGNICPQCEEKKKHLFEKDCAMINDKHGPLAACHDVLDPASYFRDCVFDVCMGDGNRKILCSSIDAYVSDCQKLGVKINNWRTSTFCPRSCPANSHYETCAKTCDSPCPGLMSIVQCPADCAEGCTCNDGFYFNGTGCVALDQCSCYFGGRTYKPREILILDNCQLKCTCQENGEVECDLMECKPDEVCGVKNGVEGCYPRQCQVEAGGVFTLFDGMGGTVTAMGAYEIVSVCDQGLAAEWFRVVVDVRRCGKTGRASITSVYVFFEDMLVSVNENHETWVNGRKLSLPKTLKGDITVKTSEKVVVIEKRSGLHVSYSLNQEISVTVGAHLTDKVCGACGKVDASSVFAHGKATNIQDFQAYMNIWKALDFSHCGL